VEQQVFYRPDMEALSALKLNKEQTTTTTTVLRPLYRTTALACIPNYEVEDFDGAEFYCLHAVAVGN